MPLLRTRPALPDLVGTLRAGRRQKYLISSALVEKVIARSLALYCLVFGAVAVPEAFRGQPAMNQVWAWCIGFAVFGSLSATVIAGLTGRHAKTAAGTASAVYLIVTVSWPFFASDPARVAPTAPWPSPLSTIAFAAAAFAFPRVLAIAYMAMVYVAYIIVRETPAGGGRPFLQSIAEAGYGLMLGLVVLLLIGMFRRASAAVDSAHGTATRKYAHAVREHRTELERVQVDSILHDSVLTTFLTAARAHSPEERHLAVAMAKHALTEVASAGALPTTIDDLVPLDQLRARFAAACEELGITAGFSSEGLKDYSIPGSVVEAFFSAVMQALTNSIQHAGPGVVTRNVHIQWRDEVLTVGVTDDGLGFDTATMTPGRLGVRVSIIERVANVGGRASIDSTPGEGTAVTLTWPAA
ncbi:signal transduction histidine kinase [Frondihabitans sp. PhB188]|uniref:sensor histidine kinase n=1 Tax=Frondihabitans sp. PhB188 TaxID=2485200 RepID=UPI000FB82D5B|nr:ATP-binding protein [Frondihabitans sp. PhB188]ROQ37112.1 signal transduction histidine kinase [Frondihabitans sp. PhB188]